MKKMSILILACCLLTSSVCIGADYELIAQIPLDGAAYDVVTDNNIAYIAFDGGVSVYDVSDPNNTNQTGFVSSVGAYRLKKYGNYLYVAQGYTGLAILDISNPYSVSVISTLDLPSGVSNFTVSDNYLYAVGWGAFYIIDISNKANPTLVSAYELNDDSSGVAVKDNYAFVGTYENQEQLMVFDVSDKTAPNPIGVVRGIYGNDMVVQDDMLYVVNQGITALDIADPQAPTIRYKQTLGSWYGSSDKLFLYAGKIFIAKRSGFFVVDASDFDLLFSHEDIPASGVYANDDYVFVVTNTDYSGNPLDMHLLIYRPVQDQGSGTGPGEGRILHPLFRAGSEADDGVVTQDELLNLYVDLPHSDQDKDVYLGLVMPGITDRIYAIDAALNLTPVPLDDLGAFPRFRERLTGVDLSGATLSLFENVPPCSLPQGTYTLYVLTINSYYGKALPDIDFQHDDYEFNSFSFEIRCR